MFRFSLFPSPAALKIPVFSLCSQPVFLQFLFVLRGCFLQSPSLSPLPLRQLKGIIAFRKILPIIPFALLLTLFSFSSLANS
jgi:hypothetical protein